MLNLLLIVVLKLSLGQLSRVSSLSKCHRSKSFCFNMAYQRTVKPAGDKPVRDVTLYSTDILVVGVQLTDRAIEGV